MDTKEDKRKNFQKLCTQYLNQQGLVELRAYGRFLYLPKPTKLKKAELIKEIVSVLCGEQTPKRTNRGAPIKNNYFNKTIVSKIEEIRGEVFNATEANEDTIIQSRTVVLNISVVVERLNEKQKQLLNDFLSSL